MAIKLDFRFIGWCNEDNHDKIWGYFVKPREPGDEDYHFPPCYAFYARRGKKLTFKKYDVYRAEDLSYEKRDKKHYRKIYESELPNVWPTFYEELEKDLCFAVLKGIK